MEKKKLSKKNTNGSCASFPELKNDIFIRAAFGQKVDRVPVWIMRQASRYLPEFREFCERHEVSEICRNPELAAEVALMPINRFHLDAAIIFSDLLVVPQALGMNVEIRSGSGINITDRLRTPDDIPRLNWPTTSGNLEGLQHVYEAVKCTRFKLKGEVPLIGFSVGPWTLMSYMVQGGGRNRMSDAKRWLYQWPEQSHRLLDMLSQVIAKYLVEQIVAGAQAVQVFESNAGYLGPQQFNQFVFPYIVDICVRVKAELEEKRVSTVPLMIFAKGAHYALPELGKLGYDVVSLDWTMPPVAARKCMRKTVTLQGNLDPCALYGDVESIKSHAARLLDEFGVHRYIASLGDGIYPDTDPGRVGIFVDAIHSVSEELLRGVADQDFVEIIE